MSLECDFCSAEVQGGTLFEHGPFSYSDHGGTLVDVEKGGFLACEACAELFNANRLRELAAATAVILQVSHSARLGFELLYILIRAHLTATRPVSEKDKPKVSAIAEHECPLCHAITVVNQNSYDKWTRVHCSGCGIETLLISKRPG